MVIPGLADEPRISIREGFIDPEALVFLRSRELGEVDLGVSLVLDVGLQKAACARAVLERQLGRRLRRLKDKDQLKHFGCSRFGDFVAERLGMSLRSAQEMMRISEKLDELPALRQASDKGQLKPSAVRLLCSFVTPEDEAEWVARARLLTVRELEEAIKSARQEDDGEPRPGKPPEEPEGERVAFEAPPGFLAKWLAAVQLYRKLEGDDCLSPGAAAQAFAQDWWSGAPLPPRSAPALGEAEPEASGTAMERLLSRLQAAALKAASRSRGRGRLGPPLPRDRDGIMRWLEEETERWAELPRLEVVELPSFLRDLDRELPSDPREVDRELRELVVVKRQLDAMTGRMLRTFSQLRLERDMAFADFEHYASERAGIGPIRARTLRHWERELRRLPLVQEAWFRGELSERHLTGLLSVLKNSDSGLVESEWLERTRELTLRRFEDEVRLTTMRHALIESRALKPRERDVRDDCVVAAPPPAGVALQAELQALEALALHAKRAKLLSARSVSSRAYRAEIAFVAEPEACRFWDDCVALCRRLYGSGLREWQCAERFIDSFVATWDQKDPYGHVLEHKVIARDGFRCTAPFCRSRKNLHAHHIVWTSRGGVDSMANLTTLCNACHLNGIHALRITVSGTAPHDLTWRLGVRADGTAFAVVGPGERLLPTSGS